jgi:hypothetical protein
MAETEHIEHKELMHSSKPDASEDVLWITLSRAIGVRGEIGVDSDNESLNHVK